MNKIFFIVIGLVLSAQTSLLSMQESPAAPLGANRPIKRVHFDAPAADRPAKDAFTRDATPENIAFITQAIDDGNHQAVDEIIDSNKFDLNTIRIAHKIRSAKEYKCVAPANLPSLDIGEPILWYAVHSYLSDDIKSFDKIVVIHHLLHYHANPDQEGYFFQCDKAIKGRLLHLCAYRNNAALTKLLLNYGANPTSLDQFGKQPLEYAPKDTLKDAPENARVTRSFGVETVATILVAALAKFAAKAAEKAVVHVVKDEAKKAAKAVADKAERSCSRSCCG